MKFLHQAATALFFVSSTLTMAQQLDCSFQTQTDLSAQGDGSLLLRQIINPENETITVEMEHTGEAWLGFAFSASGSMTPNFAAIGLPEEGVVERRYLAGKSPTLVTTSDFQTYTDSSITQENGVTTLTFTKPLIEDVESVDVVAGENIILWAVGPGNTFEQHASRGSSRVIFDECRLATDVTTTTPPPTTSPSTSAAMVSAPPTSQAPAEVVPTGSNSSTNGTSRGVAVVGIMLGCIVFGAMAAT